jgi:hypothetical protein
MITLKDGIAVDAADNPVVVGYTSSTNFPVTTNALQTLSQWNTTNASSTADDVFIVKDRSRH